MKQTYKKNYNYIFKSLRLQPFSIHNGPRKIIYLLRLNILAILLKRVLGDTERDSVYAEYRTNAKFHAISSKQKKTCSDKNC